MHESLTAGTRLGRYDIVALMDAGGMGEVYRAHDAELGRAVAIKILPAAFADHPDRLRRFELEARAAAALNHPNILAVYDVGRHDGTPYIVSELLEGQSLRARLDGAALPLRKAIEFGIQIAEGLAAAHDKGIVHRDLKPENIFVTPDERLKILDFGLAKLVDLDSATLTAAPHTSAGVVLGTVGYLSPEQASGLPADHRSDIFSVGAMLFEMVTHRRAFARATAAQTLTAVLEDDPTASIAVGAGPSARVMNLVRRCLDKSMERRFQSARDLALVLANELSDGSLGQPRFARLRVPRLTTRRSTFGWAVMLGVATLALAAYLFSPAREGARQEIRLQLSPPTGMRFVSAPAVSPDGSQMVFAAVAHTGGAARLWLRPFAATVPTELPGTEGGSFPFWSADSRVIGFFADGKLKRVAIAGGNPVIVCDASAGRGGLWLDDDTIVFAPTAFSPLVRVNAAGGPPAPWTALADDETGHRFPQRLPGRQLLYFSVNRAPEKSGTRLIAIDDPHQAINYIQSRGAAEYVKGFLLFVPPGPGGPGPVLAQRMSLPGGQLTGEPIEIGQARISESLGRFVVASSPTGVIAMLGPSDAVGQFTWIARDGRPLDTVGEPTRQLGVELSPDGQQVATLRSEEIWTMSLARPVATRVTRGGPNRQPIWSPDGAHILSLFQGRGIGTFNLVTTSVATGDVETVRQHTNGAKPVDWTRDGRLVWIEYGWLVVDGDHLVEADQRSTGARPSRCRTQRPPGSPRTDAGSPMLPTAPAGSR